MSRAEKDIYNRLFQAGKLFRKGSILPYPIHKKLQLEGGMQYLYQWLEKQVPVPDHANILDAGCGVGFNLMRLCAAGNRRGRGITISPREYEFAVTHNSCPEKCSFSLSSYDDPMHETFDTILAIESVKHTADLRNTLHNLLSHLKPGGTLILADDFPVHKSDGFLTRSFRKYWSLSNVYPGAAYIKILENKGCRVHTTDLTSRVVVSRYWSLALKLTLAYFLVQLLRPFRLHRTVAIFFGGFCLEKLYKKEKMQYQVIVATKNS